MSVLNGPTGGVDDGGDDDWTPAIGLRRGAIGGLIGATILTFAFIGLQIILPPLFIPVWLLVAYGFLTGWILLGVIERAAGMQMWPLTVLTLVLVPVIWWIECTTWTSWYVVSPGGATAGILAFWLWPTTLGGAFGIALGHYGASAADIGDLVMHNPWNWGDRG
ncbi:MAG: hypothetical protein JXO22_13565 [Phycisphaerae bacterium]|nr:hypothetical protein [Phycisphaerae bacterium]